MKGDEKQTRGTGTSFVAEVTGPRERQKLSPAEELPERLMTDDGKVVNLDNMTINSNPDLIDLGGRQVDATEFGSNGVEWVKEMYEQFLIAAQQKRISTFTDYDEGGKDTKIILEHLKRYDHGLLSSISWKNEFKASLQGGDDQWHAVGSFCWDQDSTFEQWMSFTAATLRWRIDTEIDSRRIMQALRENEVLAAKHIVGECLVVVENWLKLSENKKLISV